MPQYTCGGQHPRLGGDLDPGQRPGREPDRQLRRQHRQRHQQRRCDPPNAGHGLRPQWFRRGRFQRRRRPRLCRCQLLRQHHRRLRRRRSGRFHARPILDTGSGPANELAVGDFTGNGILDIAVPTKTTVRSRSSTATATAPSRPPRPTTSAPTWTPLPPATSPTADGWIWRLPTPTQTPSPF